MNIDDAWAMFNDSYDINNYIEKTEEYNDSVEETNIIEKKLIIPEPTDIHISTKTKIFYLNSSIDLYTMFWNIPIINYYDSCKGFIRKQMKVTCNNEEENNYYNEKLNEVDRSKYLVLENVITNVNKVNARGNKRYKVIRKISIGSSTKNHQTLKIKKTGAFYNCIALLMRVQYNDEWKEVHIKLFNTGKIEIPGIQDDELLNISLPIFREMISKILNKELKYKKDKTKTVLINSNFNCGYLIDRNKLCSILKKKYNMISMFDSCSYPGIQSKFYYNKSKKIQDGICSCEKSCDKRTRTSESCSEISFMIFRTGSVLIVGNCNEKMLYEIYDFIKNILIREYEEINQGINNEEDKKVKKINKHKSIYIFKD